MNKVISIKDALRLLLSINAGNDLETKWGEELPAIITHWFQVRGSNIIFNLIDRETEQKWESALKLFLKNNKKTISEFVYPGKNINRNKVKISFDEIPFPPPAKPLFTFIDLFAGIGGIRLAFQEAGGKCIFSSEIDRSAQQTYALNFGDIPFGDIRKFTKDHISDKELDRLIPKHDILAAGFPCQPFSRAGVSARSALKQKHGFACETQGTLFYDLVRIVKIKKPDVLFLENVKNLKRHNSGHTYGTIKKIIEEDLKYSFSDEVIDASSLVPQRRERCYIICFKNKLKKFKFRLEKFEGAPLALGSILENDPEKTKDYIISEKLWNGHIDRTARNVARGTGFTAYLADLNKPANTLVARYGKDGKECLVPTNKPTPRMLTPRECARLQGFPETFILPPSKTPAYCQFGNSVAVPVVKKIVEDLLLYLESKRG